MLAPLQGATAERVRSDFPQRFPEDIDTLVYLAGEGPDRELLLRAAALLAILDELGGVHARRARWIAHLPDWLLDLGYRAFARSRYRLFGKLEACRVPTPEERSRFLD